MCNEFCMPLWTPLHCYVIKSMVAHLRPRLRPQHCLSRLTTMSYIAPRPQSGSLSDAYPASLLAGLRTSPCWTTHIHSKLRLPVLIIATIHISHHVYMPRVTTPSEREQPSSNTAIADVIRIALPTCGVPSIEVRGYGYD